MSASESSSVSEKISAFFSSYPYREYAKGQMLVFANENPQSVFYIVSGQVRKYDISYRGDEVIVNIFKAGAFFPMSWAINKTPNAYFYKTESATELRIVPDEDALAFLRDNPDVMLDLLSRLYRGMDGLLGRMVQLMSGTAKKRLLHELIIESRRFGQPQTDGSYRLTIKEVDLAARSGLSRETVSREMKAFKDAGWVTVSRSVILVNDIHKLEKAMHDEEHST